jgi:hypothetical protein
MRVFANRPRWQRWLLWGGMSAFALLVLAQAVPYGRNHTNPPVTKEPAWDSPRTRALAVRACYDCHSNETKWLWYSNIAPVSWLVQRDVDSGRSALNFSEWDKPQDVSAGDIAEAIRGGMPPWFYTLIHRNAALNATEKNQLITGLNATFAKSPPIGGGG